MEKEFSTFQAIYLEQTGRQLRRAGFGVGPMEDGLLSVSMDERQICRVSSKGTVFFQDKAPDSETDQARERAPPLLAQGLSSPYKLLAEFSDVVLTGELGQYGAQFATWQWVQDRTNLWQGHYHDSYENANRHGGGCQRAGAMPQGYGTGERRTDEILCRPGGGAAEHLRGGPQHHYGPG